MRPLPPEPVFTADEARTCGWTPSALKHAVRTARIGHPRRGVYTVGDGPEVEALAAARVIDRAAASHRSAALIDGLPVVGGLPHLPEITVPPDASANHPGVHLHRAELRPSDLVTVHNALVTVPARMCVDVARHRSLLTAVALIDAALHGERAKRAEIEDVLRRCWNWPGIRQAQRAMTTADGRAESPLESISRVVIGRLGLPAPELQQWILDPCGRPIARTDFYWDDVGVVGEADGQDKYRAPDAFTLEKRRQEELEDLGLVVVRWGWQEAWRQHDVLRRKLTSAFERGRRRDRSGFPREWLL